MARALCMVAGDVPPARTPTATIHEALDISEERVRVKGRHYTVVEDDVIDDERLSAMALLVYIALRRHMNADGECWPKKSRIAKMARCSVRTVSTALLELQEYRYLSVQSGAVEGTSNTYVLLEGRQQVPTPSATGADQGRQQVPTEVTQEISNPKEEHAVAVAPARKEKRDTAWKQIGDLFISRGGHWTAGTKEAVSLDRLVAWAKTEYGEDWSHRLREVLDGAWLLIQGKVLGLKQNDIDFWKRQPYTPSSILGHAKRIVSTLVSITSNNTASPEYLAQLEKEYGPGILEKIGAR